MKKTKKFINIKFIPDVIKEAYAFFCKNVPRGRKNSYSSMDVSPDNIVEWQHDKEDEFFADYIKNFYHAGYTKFFRSKNSEAPTEIFEVDVWNGHQLVSTVRVALESREKIESVFNIFESFAQKARPITISRTVPRIFIGHGRDSQWKDLRDYLRDKQGFEVEHYEIEPRAGRQIVKVLDSMLSRSNFAILVMTAEDRIPGVGKMPRANVIHELGFCQGMLGHQKSIVLLEKSAKLFTNYGGVQWVPFAKGRIHETYGELLAIIKREFQ